MSFITDEVKAKRAANLKETEKKMETLRKNEVSRFFEEGIPTLCEIVRKDVISHYLKTGELLDAIYIYDPLITSAVANNPECRRALLKELQNLEEKVCGVEFKHTVLPNYSRGITSYCSAVVYFSNNQE